MKLSNVYRNRIKWAMVYHTDDYSEEVEIIDDKLFNTEKEAWDWFHSKYRVHHFIQPEAVQFHLGEIKISRLE